MCWKFLKDFQTNVLIQSSHRRPIISGLRDYGVEGQLGLEKTLDEYLNKMLLITSELKRVLKKTGTMWWNHGDSYGGSNQGRGQTKESSGFQNVVRQTYYQTATRNSLLKDLPAKSLMLQAHRLVIRMIDSQQWILRNTIIWHKPNCMPSSVKDRFTVDYEPIFFFSKSKKYWFETQYEAYELPMNRWGGIYTDGNYKNSKFRDKKKISYPQRGRSLRPNNLGRNKRCVWKIATSPFKEAHFATFPEKLIEPMIKAGCPKEGIVLDPFMGAGTTGVVAKKLNRNYLGIELNKEYIEIANKRINAIPDTLNI